MRVDGRRTILVIEDDAALREFLTDLLAGEGYGVLRASDGRDGLCSARRGQPDAILLDLGLPSVSGLDVLDELRADATTRHIPVIVVSGRDAGMADRRRDRPEAVLGKPFDLGDLLAHVERVMGLREVATVQSRGEYR